jgi:pimeloyl-ACP methyl ester carboxylesterase
MVNPIPLTLAAPGLPVLRGLVFGEGTCEVVLVHDIGDDLDAWGTLPQTVALAGYAVRAVDLPGHGLSGDPFTRELLPSVVDGILEDATVRGATHCYLITAGLVASAALAARDSARISALVALSPRVDELWHTMMRAHAGAKLVLASSLDQADLDNAQQFFQACRGPAVLSTLPVAETGCRLLASAWADHVLEQILLFLRRTQ